MPASIFDHDEPSDELIIPPSPSVSDTSLHFSPGGSNSISPSQDNKRKHPCHYCAKSFSSASNRARHVRAQHASQMADSTQIAKFNCLFCNKLCFSQHALQLHAQSCRGQLLSSASPSLPRLAELPTVGRSNSASRCKESDYNPRSQAVGVCVGSSNRASTHGAWREQPPKSEGPE